MKLKFKKILPVLLAVVLMAGAVIIPGLTNNKVYAAGPLRGDVDADGEVTASDARFALRASVGLEDYIPGSAIYLRADYDNDGKITASDARMILRTAVGLEKTKELEETTQAPVVDKNDDLSKVGGFYDPSRAGLYYYNEELIDYKDIPEGEWYTYYDSFGNRNRGYKDYSPGNEPETEDPYWDTHCNVCGKESRGWDGQHNSCWYGGCTRWIIDLNCPDCGEFVPANTCHTCKH